MDAALLAELPTGAGLPALLLALLLGIRHATDPDHVVALAALAGDPKQGAGAGATLLGLAWGVGHGLSCFALGVAFLWLGTHLPEGARLAAELAVGLLIVVLAVRLLRRWWKGRIHSHLHRHGAVEHSHPHLHESHDPEAHARRAGADGHEHRHRAMGRSPLEAAGLGLVHGVGGSALAIALVASSQGDLLRGISLLLLFGVGSTLTMALASGALGFALRRAPRRVAVQRATPALGVATLLFGVWYAGAALAELAARA